MLHLEHERRSVTYARRWVLREAAAAGVQGEAQAAVELLTSELVANALEHGPRHGAITVHTHAHDGEFEVAVTDEATELPVVRRPPPTAEGGRGIMLIDMLATSWGTRELPGHGKEVWFRVKV